MDSQTMLKNYYRRLVKEGVIKAIMLGLTVAFSVLTITLALWWFGVLKSVWLCVVFFAVAAAGAIPGFYFTKYRPTIKETAKRIDALGLEERLLTMTELERETTFIALKQRQDAQAALKKVNIKFLKIAVSVSAIVALSVVSFLCINMIALTALTKFGVVKSGKEIIKSANLKQYEVTYDVDGDGFIEGEIFQIVEDGHNATEVLAVAEEGWMFIEWSDGRKSPDRLDLKISKDMTIYAIFKEVSDDGDEEGEDEDRGPGEPDQESKPSDPSGGDGMYEDNNKVIDGNTYYGDNVYDNAYGKAMDDAAGASDGDLIEDYFDIIKK